jgi:hypothetical protein
VSLVVFIVASVLMLVHGIRGRRKPNGSHCERPDRSHDAADPRHNGRLNQKRRHDIQTREAQRTERADLVNASRYEGAHRDDKAYDCPYREECGDR